VTYIELTCDVCHGRSGGKFVGVAALTSGPMSVAFCDKCLMHNAEPTFALDYLFIFVANGDLSNLRPEVLEMETWVHGGYVKFAEYVKRITPEQVQQELQGWEATMTSSDDSETSPSGSEPEGET
jgi:hypothetical protein